MRAACIAGEFIWNLYTEPLHVPSNLYGRVNYFVRIATCHAACGAIAADPGASAMLDLLYIVIGAAFLGGCILYAFACDHL
jgi:hypothetical protein